jgi:hypothetical protein
MENKQTLEEAAENYRYNWDKFSGGLDTTFTAINFIKGAEWQAERMGYLIEALNAIESIIDNDNPSHEDIWRIANSAIEQFKKTKDGK